MGVWARVVFINRISSSMNPRNFAQLVCSLTKPWDCFRLVFFRSEIYHSTWNSPLLPFLMFVTLFRSHCKCSAYFYEWKSSQRCCWLHETWWWEGSGSAVCTLIIWLRRSEGACFAYWISRVVSRNNLFIPSKLLDTNTSLARRFMATRRRIELIECVTISCVISTIFPLQKRRFHYQRRKMLNELADEWFICILHSLYVALTKKKVLPQAWASKRENVEFKRSPIKKIAKNVSLAEGTTAKQSIDNAKTCFARRCSAM